MGNIRALLLGTTELFMHRTIACLAEDGIRADVVSQQRISDLRFSKHVDKVIHVPWALINEPDQRWADAVNQAVSTTGADVVFPTDVEAIRAMHLVGSQIPTPSVAFPSPEAFEICADKHRFSQFLATIDSPQPGHTTVWRTEQDVAAFTGPWPVMVKPVVGGGGKGVARIDTPDDLRAHLDSGAPGTSLPLLVQDYVPGSDIDCSFYAEDGKLLGVAVQTRRTLDDPEVVFVDHPGVVDVCRRVVEATEYTGLGHADLRIDERDGLVRMIEINPRIWGSVNYAMWMGANFPAFAVRRAARVASPEITQPIGACVQPPMSPLGLLTRRAQRGRLPATLNAAERLAYTTNHTDPLPLLAMQVRRLTRRLIDRVRALG